jgi:adenylate cyclase
VSMFVDMRGSTRLAEERLPYDVVFLINRFLAAASQAVTDAGGEPNQFLGDGMLALFGLDADPQTACRQAMHAATLVATNVEYLNHQLASDLGQPIEFGIGIHGGEAIVGRFRVPESNRLHRAGRRGERGGASSGHDEDAKLPSHHFHEVYTTAGIDSDALPQTEIAIRGRNEPIRIRTAADATTLSGLQQVSGTMKGESPVDQAVA